jgi:hypothetical protein
VYRYSWLKLTEPGVAHMARASALRCVAARCWRWDPSTNSCRQGTAVTADLHRLQVRSECTVYTASLVLIVFGVAIMRRGAGLLMGSATSPGKPDDARRGARYQPSIRWQRYPPVVSHAPVDNREPPPATSGPRPQRSASEGSREARMPAQSCQRLPNPV